jgi:NAD(P)H-hydrate epimerase
MTRVEHVSAAVSACPEAMVHGSVNGELPTTLSSKISCIAIGPGLGQDAWAHRLLISSLELEKPMVLDADALNLVAEKDIQLPSSNVITPHPGEASRLLSLSTTDIQSHRYTAAQNLHKLMGCIVVLKGSGTIVYDGEQWKVCPFGNPAMAVAGMGDVLTGVIASLIAQGMAVNLAAAAGVCLHAMAGDQAAGGDERGVLASDVIDQLRRVSN